MSGGALVDAVLCVVAVVAGASAAVRIASTLVPDGLERIVVATVFAAAGAVLESIGLGLFGLGGSPVALTAGAVVASLLTAAVVPRPVRSLAAELAAATRDRTWLSRAIIGTAAGAVFGLAAIALHRPLIGEDATTYHLPEAIAYVQSGHPGRIVSTLYSFPAGFYPVTEEVLLSWGLAITHGFAAAILLTVAFAPLVLAAGWLGLRELGVPPLARLAALLALLLQPLVLTAVTHPGTDLAPTAWLVCCAALLLASRRRPSLVAAAIVAAGLGIGTKTTVLSWCVVLLGCGLWYHRRRLRSLALPIAAATLVAVLTGLLWYARNWIDRGAPLWPFSSFPGGDPRPPIIVYTSSSLLGNIRSTLLDHLGSYTTALSGGVVLIVAGTLVAALAAIAGHASRRRLLLCGVVVAAGTVVWAAGPVTGFPADKASLLFGVVGSTRRYLMPVFAAGAVALAVAARDRNRLIATAGTVALVAAIAWDLQSDVGMRFGVAYDDWLVPAILAGGAVAVGAGPALAMFGRRRPLAAAGVQRATAAILVGVLAAACLAVGATGFVAGHAQTDDWAAPVFSDMQGQPAFTGGDAPVATTATGFALLAGDRLQHPMSLIGVHEGCGTIARLRRRHWIVLTSVPAIVSRGVLRGVIPAGTAAACLAHATPQFDDGTWLVFAPADARLGRQPGQRSPA